MKIVQRFIDKLEKSPWRFKTMSDADFEALTKTIQENGFEEVSFPIVCKLSKKHYIVDGHSRIKAAKKAGLQKIPCKVAESIKNHHDLRVWSFRLNREGYTNPLPLSDMVYEDLKLLKSVKQVAEVYGVNEEYINSLLKIRSLHDDTKAIIHKIIRIAKKKYQFLLNQISPEHLASLEKLPAQKQVEVVDWMFRDIMYGPADESMVSIPSIYEIMNEIENIKMQKEQKTYQKQNTLGTTKPREFPLICSCGAKYDVDLKSNTIYELLEQNNVIIKKEYKLNESLTRQYSSKKYPKTDLIDIIKNTSDYFEVRVVVSKRS